MNKIAFTAIIALPLAACNSNTAPGNDREAQLDPPATAAPIEAAATFEAAHTSVAVICSSDAVYAERAAATATALKDAGAAFVALAGHPGDRRADLEAAGVDAFFHVGVDVLAALGDLHSRLELS